MKTYNHIRVINIGEFLSDYKGNTPEYKSPFKILSALESKVKYRSQPDNVDVSYKKEAIVSFRYEYTFTEKGISYHVFTYTGFVSWTAG